MGRYALVGVVVGLASTAANTAYAYRPFDGTDADVAEFGEFELELGPAQSVREEGRDYLVAPAAVLNLGILPRVEFVIDFNGTRPLHPEVGENRYSVEDTDVVMKFLLRKGQLQDEGGPSIAFEAGALTPGIKSEQTGYGATANLIFSAKWQWFIMHLNNEAELSRHDYEFGWTNMLMMEFRASDVVWPVVEFTRGVSASETEYSALAGMIWSAADGLDIDAAWVVASVAGEGVFEARVGLTWAFHLWGESEEEADEGSEGAHEGHAPEEHAQAESTR